MPIAWDTSIERKGQNSMNKQRSHSTTASSVHAGERRSDRAPLITGCSLRVVLVHAFCWLVLWVATGAAPAAAQATGALIVGTITDMEGAALPSVAVTARNLDTGTTRKTVSENDGQYRLDGLQPGTYHLEAERDGFAITTVNNILLTVNLEFKEPLTLTLKGVQQAVSVTAAQPLILEPTSSQAGTAVIQQDQIDSLPVAGRQATQLSLLLPGTGTDSTRSQRPDANVGTGDAMLSATNYLVDGLENMISGAGDPRDNIPEGAIQEFKVTLNQAPAEFGGRAGGVVSVATKSGTNSFHGEAFEYFRDHYINQTDYYSQLSSDTNGTPIAPFSRNQYGGDAGGAIIKNRLHYFGSFERLDDKEYFTVFTGQPQDYSSLEGTFRGGSSLNTYFGRADWQINENQSLFFRSFVQNPNIYYCNGCAGGTNSAFSAGDQGVQGWTEAAGHTWVISPRVVNQLNVQVAVSKQSSLFDPRYTPAAAYAAGGSAVFKFPSMTWGFTPGTQFQGHYQEVVEALSISHHNHNLKIGGDILNVPRENQAVAAPLGTWTFSKDIYFNPTDPNFDWSSLQVANPTKFTSTFNTIPFVDESTRYSEYIQDEWKVRPNFTLNLGLRYDLQTRIWLNQLKQSDYSTPLPYVDFGHGGDRHNVAPRVGFAWSPFASGRTVVRGGFGIVREDIQDLWMDQEIYDIHQISVQFTKPTFAASTAYYADPNGLGPGPYPTTAAPNITVNASNLVNPPFYNSSFGVSHELTTDLALHVDSVYSKITHVPVNVNINTPDPTTGLRTLPNWANITQIQPIGTYGYEALYVRLDKRLSHRYQYMVSYTLSKQYDNFNTSAGTVPGSITNYYTPGNDIGPAPADRRHNLVTSGSFNARYGINIGAIYTLRSSLPFSALAGATLPNNKDGLTTDYVPGTTSEQGNRSLNLAAVNAWRALNGSLPPIPASQIESSRYNQLDMRVSKQFSFTESKKLQVIGQLFNVAGTNNFGGVGSTQVTNSLSNKFGEILSALPRHQGELAVRFVW
jgi:hypothetical protein